MRGRQGGKYQGTEGARGGGKKDRREKGGKDVGWEIRR